MAYCVLRLQTCWAAAGQGDEACVPTLGQLRKAVRMQAERDKLRALISIWEQTSNLQAAYKAAGCL